MSADAWATLCYGVILTEEEQRKLEVLFTTPDPGEDVLTWFSEDNPIWELHDDVEMVIYGSSAYGVDHALILARCGSVLRVDWENPQTLKPDHLQNAVVLDAVIFSEAMKKLGLKPRMPSWILAANCDH